MKEFGKDIESSFNPDGRVDDIALSDEAKLTIENMFDDDFDRVKKPVEAHPEIGNIDVKKELEKMFQDDFGENDSASQDSEEKDKVNEERETKDKADGVSDSTNEEENTEKDSNGEKKTRLPENNGKWEGEPGDSIWNPEDDYTPPEKSRNPDRPYSNPDNLTWKEIKDKYGIEGIPYKNGYPDFSEVSKGTVKIEGFETGGQDAKNKNFRKADEALAKERGCTPEEVRKWRQENNYTWHECEDKETMQKVPNEVHANVPHDGGRSRKDD